MVTIVMNSPGVHGGVTTMTPLEATRATPPVRLAALAVYEPAWADVNGARRPGVDEDVTTLAVAAGRLLGEHDVGRVVLVTTDPGYLEGFPDAVVAAGLGLPLSTPVAIRVGGAPAAVDAVLSAPGGTLVVAVTTAPPACAVAALVDAGGSLELCPAGAVTGYLPTRVRTTAGATAFYEDARLERERGVGPAVATLAAGADTVALAGRPRRRVAPRAAARRPGPLPRRGGRAAGARAPRG